MTNQTLNMDPNATYDVGALAAELAAGVDSGWFYYDKWRHGGWYVYGVRYIGGAVGCVSRNYADQKWRIVCDPRPFEDQPTFKNREAAARGELELALREACQFLVAWAKLAAC